VLGQVLRCFRALTFREIAWRADHCHSEIRADAHGDHVLGEELAWTNARIDLLRDNVGGP
jgi:hypothetical protein